MDAGKARMLSHITIRALLLAIKKSVGDETLGFDPEVIINESLLEEVAMKAPKLRYLSYPAAIIVII